jgi:hypothetical protein
MDGLFSGMLLFPAIAANVSDSALRPGVEPYQRKGEAPKPLDNRERKSRRGRQAQVEAFRCSRHRGELKREKEQRWNVSATSNYEQSFPLRERIVSMYAGGHKKIRVDRPETHARLKWGILTFPRKISRNHIPPHRLWTYLTAETELSLEDHVHVLECDHCFNVFRLCLQSETFGAVLRELALRDDESSFRESA